MRFSLAFAASAIRPLAATLTSMFVFFGTPNFAQASEALVKVDEATVIRLDRPAKRIIVGNPSIADVAAQSSTMLVLTGKSFGHTNLIALDENNEEIINTHISVQLVSRRAITVHRGSQRFSYACAPFCQSQLVQGDEKDYYKDIAEQISKKFGVVTNVMSGHTN